MSGLNKGYSDGLAPVRRPPRLRRTFFTLSLESLSHTVLFTETQMRGEMWSDKTEADSLLPLVQRPLSLQIHKKLTGKLTYCIMGCITARDLEVMRPGFEP